MPYYWDDAQKISLPIPAGGVPAYAGGGSGGILGGLFGGGQQQALPGLLSGGGVNDQLINQLLQRQIEAATQPDFGAFAAALGRAAQPSTMPKSIGAALGEAAGALSGNREQALARALQSAKLLQDLQLQRRKQNMFEQMFGSGAGNDPDISAAKDILGGAGIPGIRPLSSSSTVPSGGTVPAKPLIPRVPRSDETTGDLSSTYGEPPTGDAAGGDADLTAGGGTPPAPRPQAALTGSAREIADNNFGGLRKPGVYATPGQGGFQAFSTPEQGVAAISRQLDRYASGATTGKPLTTVRQIVSTWAPPNENPTEALIARASRIVGADPDAPLDVSNPQVKAKLIEATIANEQGGRVPVARDLISRVASLQAEPPPAATSGATIPPPRMPAGGSWLNQPVATSGFRTPSDAPGNQAAAERLRQSILGTLAGGQSPLVDPDQSPTAVMGGLPPQDEVIPSGRGSIPGLLKAQYSGITDPDQSPAAMLGGRGATPPMPPAAAPPMALGQPQPGVTMPTVPTPANMDPRQINQVLLNLARKSALAEASGYPNLWGPMISAIQQSPQYKAMQEYASKSATLPLEYLGPQYNLDLQTQLETMKQQTVALSKWLTPEANVALQRAITAAQEAAKAKFGTPTEHTIDMPDGTQQKVKLTPAELADIRGGKTGILPPGAKIGGETVRPPGQQSAETKMGEDAAAALKDTHAAELAAGRRIQLYGQMAQAMEGFKPGATAEIRLRAGQIYKDVFGADMPSVPSAETFQQAARQLQLAAAPKGQGSVSNYERELYASAVPTMVNSPESLAKAIEIARRLDEYDTKVAQIHRQVARENRGVPNLLEAQDRVARLGPPLSAGEMRALEMIREGKVPGAATAPGAPPPAPGSVTTPYGTIRPVQ